MATSTHFPILWFLSTSEAGSPATPSQGIISGAVKVPSTPKYTIQRSAAGPEPSPAARREARPPAPPPSPCTHQQLPGSTHTPPGFLHPLGPRVPPVPPPHTAVTPSRGDTCAPSRSTPQRVAPLLGHGPATTEPGTKQEEPSARSGCYSLPPTSCHCQGLSTEASGGRMPQPCCRGWPGFGQISGQPPGVAWPQ